MAFFGKLFQSLSFYFLLFISIVSFLCFQFFSLKRTSVESQKAVVLKIMSYSTFIKSWGPGPEIVTAFEEKFHVRVQWQDIGNSGLLLHNLQSREKDSPDVVVGIDFLSLLEARKSLQWKTISADDVNWSKDFPRDLIFKDFLPFDWSPMTFIFRRGQINTPRSLNDLIAKEYANSIAIQDPTTSTSGLYFLIWVLSVYGEEQGYKFLQSLKPAIRLVAPSWSASYSLFQNNQVPMVFSFFTSTIYHYVNEGDYRYQPVYFDEPHIYSVEYIGVPESCKQCELAEKFVQFLLTEFSQKKIMEKNFMLPVVGGVKEKTPFDFPKSIKLISPNEYIKFIEKKQDLVKEWKELNL